MIKKLFLIIMMFNLVFLCKKPAKADIFAAAREGKIDEVRKLVEEGSNPNQKDKTGKAILHYLALNFNKSDKDPLMPFLIGAGADINVSDAEGQTALFYCAASKNIKFAAELIHHGINIHLKNNKGQTAIFKAKNPEMLKLLLLAGADIHIKDSENKNLLHYSNNPASSAWLIEHGVNFKQKDKYGKTPLDYSTAEILKARDEIVNQHRKRI